MTSFAANIGVPTAHERRKIELFIFQVLKLDAAGGKFMKINLWKKTQIQT